MLKTYFTKLYRRTMDEAYKKGSEAVVSSLSSGGRCLDCGANEGYWYEKLSTNPGISKTDYFGIEWDQKSVEQARSKDINVVQGNLNQFLPYESEYFRCVFGFSVLEHLLNGCRYMRECHRVLEDEGQLVLLTPNISTFFTAALVLAGKMPSSGPHPDSDALMAEEEVFKVSSENLKWDTESEMPVHRHLVVFSYRVLKKYLYRIGFSEVEGYGFGLYPFPQFMQPMLEKIDPYHCHQMVFIARK